MLIVLLFTVSAELNGQTCCSGGTPLTGNLGIQRIESNSIYFQVAYDYNFLNDLYSSSQLLNDKTRERLTQTVLFQLIYPFSERISVNGLFTYVGQKRSVFSPTGFTNTINTNGLGDAVVLFQYAALNTLKRSLVFAIGPKLPIGKFDATDNEFGIALSPDLQPGSGSFDAILGASFLENHLLSVPGLSFSGSAGFRYTTQARRFEGDNKYRFGNESLLSVGLQKNFLMNTVGITPSIFARYRNTSNDRIDDFDLAGTGGNWIYLNPGVSIGFTNTLSINVSAELPVYRKLNGTQLTTSYRFNVGLAFKIFRN